MAEFQKVMKHIQRFCGTQINCESCPVWNREDMHCKVENAFRDGGLSDDLPEIERIVMDWAAKHPEPVYPNWNVAWKQLFPDAEESFAPCLKRMLPAAQTLKYCANYPNPKCKECREQPITADIAEKLGIKPIGGDEDA